MKQLILMVTLFTGSLLLTANTFAASSEVIWTDYESYRDIREGSMTKKKFREHLFKTIEQHIASLAAKLPEDRTLKINVTDVDLAGNINIGGIHSIRIIKQMYPPRINLSYQLIDANDNVIKSDEDVVVRDMNFMTSVPLKYRQKSFGYEKRMLDKWFKDTFTE
ncbi:MAG: DUF3016 domain-containing protein [Colwellia sp.]